MEVHRTVRPISSYRYLGSATIALRYIIDIDIQWLYILTSLRLSTRSSRQNRQALIKIAEFVQAHWFCKGDTRGPAYNQDRSLRGVGEISTDVVSGAATDSRKSRVIVIIEQ